MIVFLSLNLRFEEDFDSFTVRDPWSNLSLRTTNNSAPPNVQPPPHVQMLRPQQQYGEFQSIFP